MNDLDLVREIRASLPSPTPARLAPGRARLLASISRPSRHRHLRRVILPASAATAAAAAVAVAVAGTAIFGSGTGSAVRTTPATPLTLTAQLLNTASVTVAKRPAVRPGPHQWIYQKSIDYTYGQAAIVGEFWQTFDDHQTADLQNGQAIVHDGRLPANTGPTALAQYNTLSTALNAYNALASLPSNPKALLAVVRRQVIAIGPNAARAGGMGAFGPASQNQLGFDYLAQLLWNALGGAPPAAEAAVFRAMATIPGVTSQQGITDAAGHPAVGLSANGQTQLLLDPRTYQATGERGVSTGKYIPRQLLGHKGPWPVKGTIIWSITRAQVTLVSGPGRR